MKYFNGVHTIDELKSMYRKWAFELHPDRGGKKEDFQAMSNEYEEKFSTVKNWHKNVNGETYYKENDEKPEEFADIINELLNLKDIKVEIIGTFIWVSGRTKKHKDKLKDLGFRYQAKKRNWCKSPAGYRKRNNKKHTMNQIRNRFGVQFEAQSEKQVELSY